MPFQSQTHLCTVFKVHVTKISWACIGLYLKKRGKDSYQSSSLDNSSAPAPRAAGLPRGACYPRTLEVFDEGNEENGASQQSTQ